MSAIRPGAAPLEAAVMLVRMVGTRDTPTTMDIMMPMSTATNVSDYLPLNLANYYSISKRHENHYLFHVTSLL